MQTKDGLKVDVVSLDDYDTVKRERDKAQKELARLRHNIDATDSMLIEAQAAIGEGERALSRARIALAYIVKE